MINRTSLDPNLLAQPETLSHGSLVQEMARNQSRLGRLVRGVAVVEAAPDAATAARMAQLAQAQATSDVVRATRQFEITSERLLAMSHLAEAARAPDLAERTRDFASRQFQSLKWQALDALHSAGSLARTAGAWPLFIDPGAAAAAVASASIATPVDAAAAATTIDKALGAADALRAEVAESAAAGPAEDDAQYLDADELAKRIADQAAKSTGAQANIAPANARLLLS